jgi:hypothetical protein
MTEEKQNQDLLNTLITVAESSLNKSQVPVSKKKGVKELIYQVLKDNPYKYKQNDLFEEVHFNIRKKPELNIVKYKLQRSELCSKLGWGIHGNEEGKLALVAVESQDYKNLLINPKIVKKKAYNK